MSEQPLRLENIDEVVKSRLCTGCGTCVGVCPNEAVEMRVTNGLLLPTIDSDKCTNCRVCVKSCPGFSLNMARLNMQVFGQKPIDELVGNFAETFVGHSRDEGVSNVSSSGGVVDQLLIFALENGVIDGAVVARMRSNDSLKPEPFIARTRDEVLSASRSKYCPVATGVVLKKLGRERGKFAVVGLPCHIHGIRKAELVVPGLKDKVVLHVGLFCGHTVNFKGTDFLLDKFAVSARDVAGLLYRGNSRPDSMVVKLRNGRRLTLRFNRGWNAYWNVFAPLFFTPFRCLMCPDQFNELADVSVGDAWLPELRCRNAREAVVIARSVQAKELLKRVNEAGLLSLAPISLNKVKESQAFSLNYKKNQFAGRLGFFRRLGHRVPCVDFSGFSSVGVLSSAGALLSYGSFLVSSSKPLRRLLVHVPLPVFRLYFGLFTCVFLLTRGS